MLSIRRALINDPKPPMPDRPGLGLVPAVIDTLYETLGRPLREGLTILLVEQAVEMALEGAHRVYVLLASRRVLSGPTRQITRDTEVRRIYLGFSVAAR